MKDHFSFEAIGTQWQIDIDTTFSSEKKQDLLTQVKNRIEAFDKAYSRFRKDSLVVQMSLKKGTYQLPNDAKPLFSLYEKLYLVTHGVFTPLIGQLLSDAGYDAEYSLTAKRLNDVPSWEESLEYKFPNLMIKKPVLLDFGAAGKGYLVDCIGDLLMQKGITTFCIDAGGDIVYKTTGERKLRIGLEHPQNPKQVIGVAEIRNESICGSAGNRRQWGNFHHMIHPYTKSSPTDILAVWVVAKTGLIADALATCLFFLSPNSFSPFDFEYMLIRKDYSIEKSSHFPAEFFYSVYNTT